jgi:hypothetical protein
MQLILLAVRIERGQRVDADWHRWKAAHAVRKLCKRQLCKVESIRQMGKYKYKCAKPECVFSGHLKPEAM